MEERDLRKIQEIIKEGVKNSDKDGYILRDGFYQKTEEWIKDKIKREVK